MGEMRIERRAYVGKPEKMIMLGRLGVSGRIILNCIVKK